MVRHAMHRRQIWIVTMLLMTGCWGHSKRPPEVGDDMATTRPAAGRRVELTVRDTQSAALIRSVLDKDCRVVFRRDALGLAGNTPVGPRAEWGGTVGQLSLAGRIVDMTDQWLVVSSNGKR